MQTSKSFIEDINRNYSNYKSDRVLLHSDVHHRCTLAIEIRDFDTFA